MMPRMCIAPAARALQRVLQDVEGDAADLGVHLEGGDAVARAGDLEVHVAEVVLDAEDVGQHRDAVPLLDEPHGDPGHRRLDRHAGVHQRHASCRTPSPSTTSRSTRGCRSTRRIVYGKRRVGRDDRLDRPLGQRAVPDLAPARAADGPHLADAVGREVVVEHVALPRLPLELLDALLVLLGAERAHRQRLGLAAGEEARAVRARQHAHLDRDRADLVHAAAVGAHALAQHHLAQLVALDVVEDAADVQLLRGEALLQGGDRLLGDAVHLLLAGLLAGDADRLPEARAVVLLERGAQLGGVGRRDERPLGLAAAGDEVALRRDDRPDVHHRELERGQQVGLGDLARAALDHDDVVRRARHDHVHVALVELGGGGVHDELPVHASDAHAGDGLGERDVRQAHGAWRPRPAPARPRRSPGRRTPRWP